MYKKDVVWVKVLEERSDFKEESGIYGGCRCFIFVKELKE